MAAIVIIATQNVSCADSMHYTMRHAGFPSYITKLCSTATIKAIKVCR